MYMYIYQEKGIFFYKTHSQKIILFIDRGDQKTMRDR